MTTAFDDNFVNAYSTLTGKKQRVPKHYIGHPVLGRTLTVTPQVRDAARYPDGDPVEDWKTDQLQAYAADHHVDLTGSKASKAAMVAAITGGLRAAAESAASQPFADTPDDDDDNGSDTTTSTDGTPSSAETPANGEKE